MGVITKGKTSLELERLIKLMRGATRRGIAFLTRAQESDGHFTDFRTGIGPSDEWITGHFCWVTSHVGELKDSRLIALRFLSKRRRQIAAWGFNADVEADCDSTSQIILALRANGLGVSRVSIPWLLSHQASGGGFSTYRFHQDAPFNSWSLPHHETTLDAWAALKVLGRSPQAVSQAYAWLKAEATRGVLSAFWWDNPAYMLWSQKKLNFCRPEARVASYRVIGSGEERIPH